MKKFIKNYIEQYPKLAQSYRNLRDQFDKNSPPIKTQWGFMLAGNEIMARGLFEPEETQYIRSILNEIDILINVGANIGYYCCHALSMGKEVIAFEPIARNIHYLLKNIKINGWDKNIEIYPVALGAGTNILEIWGGNTGASLVNGWASTPQSYVTLVPVLTLDSVIGCRLEGKKALILVDIEGAEFMFLQGSHEIMKNNPRPIWFVEICSHLNDKKWTANLKYNETFQLFYSYGYRAWNVKSGRPEINIPEIRATLNGNNDINGHNYIFRV